MPAPSAMKGLPHPMEPLLLCRRWDWKGNHTVKFLVYTIFLVWKGPTYSLLCAYRCARWEGCPNVHGSTTRQKLDLHARDPGLENGKSMHLLCSPGGLAASFTGLIESYVK